MADAKKDANYNPSLIAVSNVDSDSVVRLEADPITKRLLVASTGGSGASEVDDSAFTAGTDSGTPAMGFFSTDTVDSGDVGVLAMDASRRLFVSLEVDNVGLATSANQLADGHNVTVDNASGASAVNIQDGGNSITVDSGATFTVQEDGAALTALELIDDTVATLGTTLYSEATTKGLIIGAVRNDTLATLAGTDNEIAPLQVNASGAVYVVLSAGTAEIGKLAAGTAEIGNVKNSGTFAVQSTLQTGSNAIGKLAANSGVDIGDVDVTSLPVDGNHFSATVTSADATTATSVKAKTADKKIHVTSLVISVGSTAIEVQLQSDNGTPQVVMEEMFFAANGGLTLTACDPKLPLFIVNTNEDLDVITSAAGDVTIHVSGYVV